MFRWWTRRPRPNDLQLLAQVNGLLLRQETFERHAREVLSRLEQLQQTVGALEPATPPRRPWAGPCPFTPGMTGD